MGTEKRIRVLVAEDDGLAAEMTRGLLERSGYEVIGTARDGFDAVEMTRKLTPDVVLMDIKMPGKDGLNASKEIQEVQPTPIVVLTSHDTPELVRQASESGVGAYLMKPPERAEMERAISISMARFDDLMELHRLNLELKNALTQIKTLRGLLPICASCKKIRDDSGYWEELESYMLRHSEAQFSHGICPECMERMYPDLKVEEEEDAGS